MGLLFMVHVCKMIISPSTFFSFLKFWFSGPLRGWRSKRARYSPKSENIMYVTLHISGAIHHMIRHLHKCKMMGSPVVVVVGFFSFFQNFGFSGCSWGIRKKMAQNDKKFSQSCPISQDPFIIWLSFVVRKCKIIKSPGLFFIFSKLWFFGLLGGSKGKKWPKMAKNSVVPFISRAIYHMIFIYGTHV